MNTSRKYIIVIISREEKHPFLNIQNNYVLCICYSYGLYETIYLLDYMIELNGADSKLDDVYMLYT